MSMSKKERKELESLRAKAQNLEAQVQKWKAEAQESKKENQELRKAYQELDNAYKDLENSMNAQVEVENEVPDSVSDTSMNDDSQGEVENEAVDLVGDATVNNHNDDEQMDIDPEEPVYFPTTGEVIVNIGGDFNSDVVRNMVSGFKDKINKKRNLSNKTNCAEPMNETNDKSSKETVTEDIEKLDAPKANCSKPSKTESVVQPDEVKNKNNVETVSEDIEKLDAPKANCSKPSKTESVVQPDEANKEVKNRGWKYEGKPMPDFLNRLDDFNNELSKSHAYRHGTAVEYEAKVKELKFAYAI